MEGYRQQYEIYRAAVEERLESLFSDVRPYGQLQKAMSYSLLAGGKRVRPVLTLAVCDMLGGQWRQALPFACALELVHTYSLIHDDLPCMDDDDLRRGKPTCHKVFGETMAVLAGDALQPEAFRLIACAEGMEDRQRVAAVRILADACGGDGMVAGQVLDILGRSGTAEELRQLHRLKTGAMIRAAALLGCAAADAGEETAEKAAAYADHIGLAFQVRDDMLDVIADQNELGKPIGSDAEEGKVTFVDHLGLEACAALVEQETALAKEAVAGFAGNEFLLTLADQLAARRA